MREKLDQLEEYNVHLLAIDPHESWAAKYLLKEVGLTTDAVNYPLLMDPAHTVSAAYGVAFQMRIHTEWSNRPATFIIDQEGILRFARRGTSFSDRPTVNDILSEVQKLQQ